ncbi:MAG: hypothetical protein EOM54_12850 [Clostridia bacterium]|nr:hypothetical protein [Clostridia bacterium]
MLNIKAVFERKATSFNTDNAVISAVEFLPHTEFLTFSNRLMCDSNVVERHIDAMGLDNNGTRHTLLVLSEGADDGILVDSQGYSYARYSAWLPGYKPYFEAQIQMLADKIIEDGMKNTDGDYCRIGLDEIGERYGVEVAPGNGIGTLLLEKLKESEVVESVAAEDSFIEMSFNTGLYAELSEACRDEPWRDEQSSGQTMR